MRRKIGTIYREELSGVGDVRLRHTTKNEYEERKYCGQRNMDSEEEIYIKRMGTQKESGIKNPR